MLVLDHIPKTAGTALRQVARANAPPGDVVDLDAEVWLARHRIDQTGHGPTAWRDGQAFFRSFYDSLPGERRSAPVCFLGHSAPMFIAAVTDRPVRAFCLLRDPVDRMVSLYRHLKLRETWTQKRTWTGFPGFLEAMRREGWTLKDAYRELGSPSGASVPGRDEFSALFNGQTRHLLGGTDFPGTMPFEPGAEDLADYKERVSRLLSERYVVGTQDRFSQSVRLFADTFGWRRSFLPRARVNPTPLGWEEIDPETRELIRVHNRLDAELHARYSERLRDLPSTSRLSDANWRVRRRVARRVGALRNRLRTPVSE